MPPTRHSSAAAEFLGSRSALPGDLISYDEYVNGVGGAPGQGDAFQWLAHIGDEFERLGLTGADLNEQQQRALAAGMPNTDATYKFWTYLIGNEAGIEQLTKDDPTYDAQGNLITEAEETPAPGAGGDPSTPGWSAEAEAGTWDALIDSFVANPLTHIDSMLEWESQYPALAQRLQERGVDLRVTAYRPDLAPRGGPTDDFTGDDGYTGETNEAKEEREEKEQQELDNINWESIADGMLREMRENPLAFGYDSGGQVNLSNYVYGGGYVGNDGVQVFGGRFTLEDLPEDQRQRVMDYVTGGDHQAAVDEANTPPTPTTTDWNIIRDGILGEVAGGRHPTAFFPKNLEGYVYTHDDGTQWSWDQLPSDVQAQIRSMGLSDPDFVARATEWAKLNRPEGPDWRLDPTTYEWVEESLEDFLARLPSDYDDQGNWIGNIDYVNLMADPGSGFTGLDAERVSEWIAAGNRVEPTVDTVDGTQEGPGYIDGVYFPPPSPDHVWKNNQWIHPYESDDTTDEVVEGGETDQTGPGWLDGVYFPPPSPLHVWDGGQWNDPYASHTDDATTGDGSVEGDGTVQTGPGWLNNVYIEPPSPLHVWHNNQWIHPYDSDDTVVDDTGQTSLGMPPTPNPYHADLNAQYDWTAGEWKLPATTMESYNPNPGGVDWTQDDQGNWTPPPVVDTPPITGTPPVAGPPLSDTGEPQTGTGLIDQAGEAASDRIARGGNMFRDPEEEKAYWDWQLKPAVDAAETGFRGILGKHIGAGTFGGGMMDAQTARMMGDFRRDIGEDYLFPYMRERGAEERADIELGARVGEQGFRAGEDEASRLFDQRIREAEVTGYLDDTMNLNQLGFSSADYFSEAGAQSIDQRKAYERDLPAIKESFERVMGRELTSSELQRLVAGEDIDIMRPTASRYATEEEIRQGREKLTNEGRRVSVEENRLEIDQTLAMIKEWEVRGYTDEGQRIGSWLKHMEDRDFEAIVRGGGFYTVLDEEGNPIKDPETGENKRIRIYGTDELTDRQFIREEDRRNGYNRVGTYTDENGEEQIQYDENGNVVIERVYGADEIDRLDRERDDQWERDKYTGFYFDRGTDGHPIWIDGTVNLASEERELRKELQRLGFDHETAERIAREAREDKVAGGFWTHDGRNPVYVMGTQSFQEHVTRIASELQISQEEARMFLRAQERTGFSMIREVPTGFDDEGNPTFATKVVEVEGTWTREERVQKTADELVRDGWDADIARIFAASEADSRSRNGYWSIKQVYNPDTKLYEAQYEPDGKPIVEWVRGSTESQDWINEQAAARDIEKDMVRDALSRATGDAEIIRTTYVTARAAHLMSTGMARAEAYAQASEEAQGLSDEQFKKQYGETLQERLANKDLEAADKRYDAAQNAAMIQSAIGSIATIGAALFPILFDKGAGILGFDPGSIEGLFTIEFLRTLLPDATDDELASFQAEFADLLAAHGYNVRIPEENGDENGDGKNGYVDTGGEQESDKGKHRKTEEQVLGYTLASDAVSFEGERPTEINKGELNDGPWSDDDWTIDAGRNQTWFDNGGTIEIDDLYNQEHWGDYLRSGTGVSINGHRYTPEGFANLYEEAAENYDDVVQAYAEELGFNPDDAVYPDLSTGMGSDLANWLSAYERANSGLQPERWWKDFRGEGKAGVLEAVGRILTFKSGFELSYTGQSENAWQLGTLALATIANPASLGYYVAGRTIGGLVGVWTGAAETRWEEGGVMLPRGGNSADRGQYLWFQKYAPDEFWAEVSPNQRGAMVDGEWVNAAAAPHPASFGRVRYDKDDKDLVVEWGIGEGAKSVQILHTESPEEFIGRTGQLFFPLSHFSDDSSPYGHMGDYLKEVFDLDFSPEYAIIDVESLDVPGYEGVQRQFEGERVIRFVDADTGTGKSMYKVITGEEWDKVLAAYTQEDETGDETGDESDGNRRQRGPGFRP